MPIYSIRMYIQVIWFRFENEKRKRPTNERTNEQKKNRSVYKLKLLMNWSIYFFDWIGWQTTSHKRCKLFRSFFHSFQSPSFYLPGCLLSRLLALTSKLLISWVSHASPSKKKEAHRANGTNKRNKKNENEYCLNSKVYSKFIPMFCTVWFSQ